MNIKPILLIAASACFVLGIAGCDTSKYGQVEQGRVVAFDAEKRVVTVVHDSAIDPIHPVYDTMPAVQFTLPTDPAEVGPLPKAGQRLKLDIEKKQIELYDIPKANLVYLDIEIVDLQQKIDRTHPLVYDATAKAAKPFPIIDSEKKTVTVYSSRQKVLCTFVIPEGYADRNVYPLSTWDAGDEVRIYFKTEGQALRFMNISKTDIYKR
ncbi:MAG: DUF4881 domain-containing protein [bacterium]|nr:DUF4881 domain-containing protein [bacterium]